MTIKLTKDYHLHVEVTQVPTGEHSIRISSTWPGAKDPDEKRVLFQATGCEYKIRQIGYEISQQSNAITVRKETE